MGLYGAPKLEEWFVKEYADQVTTKLDMGKSCIRFKNPDHIPYGLIAELLHQMTVDEFIAIYEQSLKKK